MDRRLLTRRYQLRERLGAGGFGTVWEAWDHRRGTPVALKLLRADRPMALLRFKREFRTLAELRLPHLVTLYELAADEGEWFYTMERLRGHPFGLGHAVVEERSLRGPETTFDDAASAASLRGPARCEPPRRPVVDRDRLRSDLVQLTTALEGLHEAGLVHCDLKPSNVLVAPDGGVKVLDFGLVSSVDAEHDGGFRGTPTYASPEQLMGVAFGPETDWYAVGVMLYEVLAGRPPFVGDLRQQRLLKQQASPPPLPAMDDLADVCLGLLEREASRRATGHDLRRVLGAHTTTTPLTRRTALVGRGRSWPSCARPPGKRRRPPWSRWSRVRRGSASPASFAGSLTSSATRRRSCSMLALPHASPSPFKRWTPRSTRWSRRCRRWPLQRASWPPPSSLDRFSRCSNGSTLPPPNRSSRSPASPSLPSPSYSVS